MAYEIRNGKAAEASPRRTMSLVVGIALAAASCFGLIACPTQEPTPTPSTPEPSDLVLFPPYALGFGEVQIGDSAVLPWTICNTGTEQIAIAAITASNPDFVPATTSATLAAGDSQDIDITFTPTSPGAALGLLTLQTQDASQARKVALGGAGTNELIAIEARPFGVLPGEIAASPTAPLTPEIMLPLGVFAITVDSNDVPVLGEPQGIGIYLKNTGATPLRNVEAHLEFPAYSGIVVDKDVDTFGDLQPGVPVLGFFSGDFSASAPGLYDATLDISVDGVRSGQTSRKIYVMKVIVDTAASPQDDSHTAIGITPGGTITRVNASYLDAPPQLAAVHPRSIAETFIPSSPYSGQVSPPPFPDDAPHKVVGLVSWGLSTLVMGFTEDKTARKVAAVGAVLGGVAVFLDGRDAFRRGQLNTVPLPAELTIKETIDAKADYVQTPGIGDPFTVKVSWVYTRFLDSGRQLTHSVTETVRNDRIITERKIAVNQDSLVVGDDLVITAQFRACGGRLLSGLDAYVFAGIDTDGDTSIDKSVLLRDDGQQGDAVALDGLYNGTLTVAATDNLGTWNIFVFAQDINLAPQSSDITFLPYFIGGIGLSFPADDGVNILPDKVVTTL